MNCRGKQKWTSVSSHRGFASLSASLEQAPERGSPAIQQNRRAQDLQCAEQERRTLVIQMANERPGCISKLPPPSSHHGPHKRCTTESRSKKCEGKKPLRRESLRGHNRHNSLFRSARCETKPLSHQAMNSWIHCSVVCPL